MIAADITDTCKIVLGSSPQVDAFGLSLTVDGEEVLATVGAAAPGMFRTGVRRGETAVARAGQRLSKGMIAGFLQQGPLLLPIRMPEDGWLAAVAPEGTAVGHGAPVIRYIRVVEGIVP